MEKCEGIDEIMKKLTVAIKLNEFGNNDDHINILFDWNKTLYLL